MGLTKDSFERMCRAAGILPAYRETYCGREIVVGYGFVEKAERDLQKFGVSEGDWPTGCYAVAWAIPEGENIPVGMVVPNPPVPVSIIDPVEQTASRIAFAVGLARAHIDSVRKYRRAHLNG